MENKYVCELCNKEKIRMEMYLVCAYCKKVFTCFGCGSSEIHKRYNGLPCRVYGWNVLCQEHIKTTYEDYKKINL